MRIGNKFSLALLLTVGIILSGCFKDDCDRIYTMYLPVYKTLTQVRAEMKSSLPQVPEQTGKLYVYGQYIFLNEVNKGIHVIDNTDPAQPKNISFIPIPGNVDLAVKGNYLYADSYSDMIVFDVSNPTTVTAKKFVNDVFPERKVFYAATTSGNPDSINVVVGYTEKDTMVNCQTYRMWYDNCPTCMSIQSGGGARVFYSAAAAAAPSGKGGSMARFTLASDYLYTVSSTQLFAFNISNAVDPQLVSQSNVGWGIETIYPFRDKLFIGSTTGMFIYDISTSGKPSLLGRFAHARSCDPVIADDNFAYVTLRSGSQCQGFSNQLDILDISNLMQPQLKKTYSFTNPHGLAKDGNILFICDGNDGLKIYDATDVNSLIMLRHITGMETFDVITLNGLALVVAKDGLYQYDYRDPKNIRQISKISISK